MDTDKKDELIDLDELINSLLTDRPDKPVPGVEIEQAEIPLPAPESDKAADDAIFLTVPPIESESPDPQEELRLPDLPPVTEEKAVTPEENDLPELPKPIEEINPFLFVNTGLDDEDASFPDEPGKNKPGKEKRRRWFGRKKDKNAEDLPQEQWVDWDLKPIGHYTAGEEKPEDGADTDEKKPETEPIREEPTREEPQKPAEAVIAPATGPAVLPVIEDNPAVKPIVEDKPAVMPVVEDKPAVQPVVEDKPAVQPVVEDKPAAEGPADVMDEFPPIQSEAKIVLQPIPSAAIPPAAIPVDEPTRLVVPTVTAEPVPAAEEVAYTEQAPGQMSLEEMFRIEDIASENEDETEDAEDTDAARFFRQRQEKVRQFTLPEDTVAGEETPEPPEPVPPVEEDVPAPEAEEPAQPEDEETIRQELQYQHKIGLFTLLLTGVLEIIVFIVTLLPLPSLGGNIAVHLFVLVLMGILNYSAMGRGFSGLFRWRFNADTGTAVAAAFTFISTALHFAHPGTEGPLPLWTPLVGLLFLSGAAAKYIQGLRIENNFAFVAYPGEKYAASLITEPKALREIGRRVTTDREAKVMVFRRTAFLSDFLANSAEEDEDSDRLFRYAVPIACAVSLVGAIIGALTAKVGFWGGLQMFVGMLCLSVPVISLAMQVHIWQSSRRMISKGGMLIGWKAVKEYGKPDALTVDAADLYPDESMLLHGIKTFAGAHIDDAIMDAASLAIRSGGPLAMVFRRMIENNESLLRNVENLVYEQGMGLSGWVDGRRVLIGNRRLLENHGVDVPSSDYEARYLKDKRRLIYLSTAGELSAMFVITYSPNRIIRKALQKLCRAGITLLVRTNDPNITAVNLCDDFELDECYVDVLPAAACRLYDEVVADRAESVPAVMASNGHILGTALVLSVCRDLQVKSRIAMIIRIIMGLLGVLIGALLATTSSVAALLLAMLYYLVTMAISCFAPFLRRM